jgi:SAM-dependent methyltransferase
MRVATASLLGDDARRDYAAKLQLFNRFAAPELRAAIAALELKAGDRVLDAGCGSGETLPWLAAAASPGGFVVGLDLARAHIVAAQGGATDMTLLQADLQRLPLRARCVDLVWCVNTLHHLEEPVRAARELAQLVRPGGRVVVGQSSFLPDMYFAWDARLERLTNEAVRRYYRDRYDLTERDLAAVRALVGILRSAGLTQISVRTCLIERIAPLTSADEAYLAQAIFRDTWGERLRPYLSENDFAELAGLCDPTDARFALRRADFHFLQSFTVVAGHC